MASENRGVIHGRVTHGGADRIPIGNAEVLLYKVLEDFSREGPSHKATATDREGRFRFEDLDPGKYLVECSAFVEEPVVATTHIHPDCLQPNPIDLNIPLRIEIHLMAMQDNRVVEVPNLEANRKGFLRCESAISHERIGSFTVLPEDYGLTVYEGTWPDLPVLVMRTGHFWIRVHIVDKHKGAQTGTAAETMVRVRIEVLEPEVTLIGGQVGVQLKRTRVDHTPDQALWTSIRLHTRRIGFDVYQKFIDRVLCGEDREQFGDKQTFDVGRHGVAAYELLRYATEVFLLRHCGVDLELHDDDRRHFHRESEEERLQEPVTFDFIQQKLREYLGSQPQLPYITRIINAAFPWDERREDRNTLLTCHRLRQPCLLELIWSYWHEEGMLMQTMNAVARRFQNLRSYRHDPLANLEIDPLRPLNNILWGFIQDEFRRLTVKRRAYEYSHQYGLSLYGRAVERFRPADNRSKFLEAFHNLLHLCSVFFKEDNDTTVIADGYPLLHSLQEVHLLLAQGAQNQFGDLPWTARAEMLVQQWMLARPEIRDFLQSRAMVPYKEPWMPQVDAMKTMQGWSDVTVTHFRDLGVFGEQILLSIRYGDWVAINDEDFAKNWARYWRPEIQGYLHAYRAATGVDLTHGETADATMPSLLLQSRLEAQQQRMR